MSGPRITLDEFMARAAVSLEAFADATRQEQAKGSPDFVGRQHTHRTEEDWWREVSAYFSYVEAKSMLKHIKPK